MNFNQVKYVPHTVRYLKPVQVVFRLKMLAQTKFSQANKNGFDAHGKISGWQPLKKKTNFKNRSRLSDDEIKMGHFTFLNDSAEFGDVVQWSARNKSRLWRYNLHYFDYLFSNQTLDQPTSIQLMESWIIGNPPGTTDAWDPFPISLRLVNWIKYFSTRSKGQSWPRHIIRSAYEQVLRLERNLEYYLLGNHLFKNAKALIFAGLFFSGTHANRWLNKGCRLLDEQIEEQILPDGGHFERSPIYHAMVLEDCLDLLNITDNRTSARLVSIRKKLENAADRMVGFLNGMSHPDGEIALFNDAAIGIEHTPQGIVGYCEGVTGKEVNQLDGKSWSFPDTGYYVMAPKNGDRMFIDCGPVGPDYQPGHSHCDTLSIELSLKGRRVIIDSGCFQYEDGPIRQYNRGNAGHNTITVDGENQSEVWGAHRCARRAKPIYAKIEEWKNSALHFEGAHDGYKRLNGCPIHHRRVTWKGREILIEDCLTGSGAHHIESRLHIHPDLKVELSGQEVRIRDEEQLMVIITPKGQGNTALEEGWYCPEFGKKISCSVISFKIKNASLPIKCGWVFHINPDS